MQVHLVFDFAKIYNIAEHSHRGRFDVSLGQKFTIKTRFPGPLKYFIDNDPVLSVEVVDNNTINFEATRVGRSTILILDSAFCIKKVLTIKVVDGDPISNLGLMADDPEPK